ncbi:LysR family transcriptional regulator [Marinibaculum pumilum]|uniref:LysR family transcriptional regulator n=1 Tax=Marinibaculum pumilum TaxID=1766165 RepID=A0ABV7KZV9_9PROT
MDRRQLRYFAAIFEERNLSRAARACNVAQSALSHHLAGLEAELGSPLFRRRPRGMLPTAAGERLYQHAKGILRAMEAAEADIRQAGDRLAGEVSIGMAYSAVKAIGVPFMRRVTQDYPQVRVSITESLSASTLLHVMKSDVELALVYNPPDDPLLETQPVLEEEMICVGRPEIIGATDDPIAFDALLDLPLILLRQGASSRALIDDPALLKRLEARAKLQMNSVHAISGALAEGIGCIIGTRLFMREQLEAGTLHARPIVNPTLSRSLQFCRLVDHPATFVLEAMQGLLLELIRAEIDAGRWQARPLF